MLEVEHVTVGYRGREVLRDVSCSLGPGLHVLLGANGAGKTTLLRAMAGILPLLHGSVDVTDAGAVALSGHRAALAPRMSVRDNLEYWARVLRLPAAARRVRTDHVVGQLGLSDLLTRRAGVLSRGQAQRVNIAKALLGEPAVLLLDEPLSGVDPSMAEELRELLIDLGREGRVVLISSHELEEIANLGDDVLVLRDGQVAAHGPSAQLRRQLVGAGYRLQVRGTSELAAAVRQLGHEIEVVAPDTVVVDVADEEAARSLIDALAARGVGIYEARPVRSALGDIYRSLHGRA